MNDKRGVFQNIGYIVTGRIGGEVYGLKDINDGMHYAGKVLRDVDVGNEKYLELVGSPQRNLAAINCLHTHKGYTFLVMPRLKELVLHRPVAEEVVWRKALEVLRALQAIHLCGACHGDVKLPNIMVSDTGECVVTDACLRAAGRPLFTCRSYIVEEASPATDCWQLAQTLMHMCTGVSHGELSDASRLREHCPHLSEELETFLDMMLRVKHVDHFPVDSLLQFTPASLRLEAAYYFSENRQLEARLKEKEARLTQKSSELASERKALTQQQLGLVQQQKQILDQWNKMSLWYKDCLLWKASLDDWSNEVEVLLSPVNVALPPVPRGVPFPQTSSPDPFLSGTSLPQGQSIPVFFGTQSERTNTTKKDQTLSSSLLDTPESEQSVSGSNLVV
eukprot:TRINITY_DN33749_c0_g1_i1.p1 TRINITY_DN33749_c0_g1~~TRINITY_DN33749_c0_g1_i1.p1  ORF type:complete len:392 (+),score=49.67 TRINITY_DN33749_c0_g1_i1:41-1216(+)